MPIIYNDPAYHAQLAAKLHRETTGCTCEPYTGWHGYGCPLDQGLTPAQWAMVNKVHDEITKELEENPDDWSESRPGW